MTLDQLETFVAIAEEGGLRAASKVLHKTQPTLSTGIKNLEEELGLTLLDRDAYRVQLTPEGEMLFLKAKEVLQQAKQFQVTAKELSMGKEPKINLAIDYLCPMSFLLNILNEYSRNCQTTKIEIDFEILTGTENRILNGESTIGITPFISKHSKMDFEKIGNIKIVPVISKSLFPNKKPSLKQLLQVPQIVVKDSSKNENKGSFGTFSDSPKWIVSDHSIKKELILSGFGWGHLEETSIAKELKSKKILKLRLKDIGPKTMPLYITRSLSKPFGPVSTDLWNYITNQFKDHSINS